MACLPTCDAVRRTESGSTGQRAQRMPGPASQPAHLRHCGGAPPYGPKAHAHYACQQAGQDEAAGRHAPRALAPAAAGGSSGGGRVQRQRQQRPRQRHVRKLAADVRGLAVCAAAQVQVPVRMVRDARRRPGAPCCLCSKLPEQKRAEWRVSVAEATWGVMTSSCWAAWLLPQMPPPMPLPLAHIAV